MSEYQAQLCIKFRSFVWFCWTTRTNVSKGLERNDHVVQKNHVKRWNLFRKMRVL